MRVTANILVKRMKQWQSVFHADADDQAIRLDTGPEAHGGFYVSGPLAGKAVSPTALMNDPPVADAAAD